MSDSTNICLACGLCCEGVLIGFVHLSKDEIPALKKIMEIEEEGGQGFFLQPCKKYCNGCTIYSERPKQCGYFDCDLLTAVDKKEIDFDAAVEIVDLVRQKKAVLEQKVLELKVQLKSQSFYFKMVELKNVLEKTKVTSSLSELQLDVLSDLKQLDSLLLERFGVTLN